MDGLDSKLIICWDGPSF
jgi:hypothetical protein